MDEQQELIESLLETIEDLKTRCATNERTNSDLLEQISTIEANLQSVQEENKLLKSNELNLTTTSSLYADTVRELSTLQVDTKNKKEEIKFLKDEMFRLNEEILHFKKTNNSLKKELEECQNRLSVTQSENKSLLMSVTSLNSAKDKLSHDLSIATDRLYAYERELSTTSEHLDNFAAVDISQKTKLKEALMQKGNLEFELNLKDQTIEELNKEIISLNYHLSELNADYNTQIQITKEIELLWDREKQKNIELSTVNATLEARNERSRHSLTPRQPLYTPGRIPLT